MSDALPVDPKAGARIRRVADRLERLQAALGRMRMKHLSEETAAIQRITLIQGEYETMVLDAALAAGIDPNSAYSFDASALAFTKDE